MNNMTPYDNKIWTLREIGIMQYFLSGFHLKQQEFNRGQINLKIISRIDETHME